MTSPILMYGHRVEVRQDRFPDGRTCWVAEDLDVPGCVAYSENDTEAVTRMVALRALLEPGHGSSQVIWPTQVSLSPAVSIVPGRTEFAAA